jgi:hypothetical protein
MTPPPQNAADAPTPPDPDPVQGLHLPVLHHGSQDVLCCDQPMQWTGTNTEWTGPPGAGATHDRTDRTCTRCGATLTITSTTPS